MSPQAVLDDLGKELDFVFEATGLNPIDPAITKTFRWSVHGRRHGAADATGAADIPPLLINPGGFTLGLSADQRFAGLAEASRRQIVVESPLDPAHPWHHNKLRPWIFTDQSYAVKVGERGAPWSTFGNVHSGTMREEPLLEPGLTTFTPATVMDKLRGNLDTGPPYIGQQTAINIWDGFLISSGPFTAPHQATYDASGVTIACRVRYGSFFPAGGGEITLLGKGSKYRLWLDPFYNLNGAVTLADGKSASLVANQAGDMLGDKSQWKTLAMSLDPSTGRFFLLISPGNPFDPTQGLVRAETTVSEGLLLGDTSIVDLLKVLINPTSLVDVFEVMDVRLWNRGLTADQLTAQMARPSSSGDVGLMASWRFSDNFSTTPSPQVTDWVGSNHATTTGSAVWVGSGEGTPALAGRPRSRAFGRVEGGQLVTLSTIHSQYGVPESGITNLDLVRSRGVPVFRNGDSEYDTSRDLLDPSVAQATPLTFDSKSFTGLDGDRLHSVLERGANHGVGSTPRFDHILANLQAGLNLPEPRPSADLIAEVCKGVGASVFPTRSGALTAEALVLAATPTPVGGACIDVRSSVLDFGNIGNTAANLTIFAWVYPWGFGVSRLKRIAYKGDAFKSDYDYDFLIDANGCPRLDLKEGAATSTVTATEPLPEREWSFVAFVNRGTGKNIELYIGSQKRPAKRTQVFAGAGLDVLTSSNAFRIGAYTAGLPFGPDSACALCHVGFADSALNGRKLRTVSTAPIKKLPAFLDNFMPLSEGSGNPTELATSNTATFTGTWLPQHRIFLDEMDVEPNKAIKTKRLRGAKAIEVLWGRNSTPLGPADIGGFSVTGQFTFNDNHPSADTITRGSGSWITDGFVVGMLIQVESSRFNDRTGFKVDGVTATTLTLSSADSLTDEGPVHCEVGTLSAAQRDDLQREWKAILIRGSAPAGDTVKVQSVIMDAADASHVAAYLDERTSGKEIRQVPGDRRHYLAEIGQEIWLKAQEPGLQVARGFRILHIDVDLLTDEVFLILWGAATDSEDNLMRTNHVLATHSGDIIQAFDGVDRHTLTVTRSPR